MFLTTISTEMFKTLKNDCGTCGSTQTSVTLPCHLYMHWFLPSALVSPALEVPVDPEVPAVLCCPIGYQEKSSIIFPILFQHWSLLGILDIVNGWNSNRVAANTASYEMYEPHTVHLITAVSKLHSTSSPHVKMTYCIVLPSCLNLNHIF